VPAAKAVKVPVAGSIVPHFGEGMTVQALAPDYRRIVELVESGSRGREGVTAREIASGLVGATTNPFMLSLRLTICRVS